MSNMIHQGKPTPQQSVEVQSAKPTPTSLSSARPAQLRQGQVAPEQVLHLQRTIGNQAVARLLNRHAPVVQPKLTVGPVGDAYEQEAERIAAQVAKGPAPVQRHTEDDPSSDEVQRSPLAAAITPLVQRHHAIRGSKPPQEEEEEAGEGEVQRAPSTAGVAPSRQSAPLVQRHHAIRGSKPPQEEEEEAGEETLQRSPALGLQRHHAPPGTAREDEASVQRKENGKDGFDPGRDFTRRLDANQGRGRPLEAPVRRAMESSFGTRFDHVRIHTGPDAIQMSRDIQAEAFTHGSHVYFNQGNYAPGATAGRRLLAHELTHVVQQTGAAIQRAPEKIQRFKSPRQWWRERKAKKEQEKNTVDYQSLHNIKKGHLLPDTNLMAEPRMKQVMSYQANDELLEGAKWEMRHAVQLIDDDEFMRGVIEAVNASTELKYTVATSKLKAAPAHLADVRSAFKTGVAGKETSTEPNDVPSNFKFLMMPALPKDDTTMIKKVILEEFLAQARAYSAKVGPTLVEKRPEEVYQGLPGMSQTEAFLEERSKYKFEQVTVDPADIPRWAAALKQMETIQHLLTEDKSEAPAKTVAEWKDAGPLTDKITVVKDARKVGYLGKHADYIDNKRAKKQGFRDRIAQADAMMRAVVEPEQLHRVPRPSIKVHTRGSMSYTNPLGKRAGAAAGDLGIGYNEDMETIAHELGHIIEEYMPMDAWHDIHMLLNERHKAKGGGKYARRGETIFTYFSEGRYGGNYVTGKYTTTAYSKDNAEVVSMWMQFMASPEKAQRLIDGDPQHAALVLRAMRPSEYNSTPALRPFDKYLPMKEGKGPMDRYKDAQEKVERLYKEIGTGG